MEASEELATDYIRNYAMGFLDSDSEFALGWDSDSFIVAASAMAQFILYYCFHSRKNSLVSDIDYLQRHSFTGRIANFPANAEQRLGFTYHPEELTWPNYTDSHMTWSALIADQSLTISRKADQFRLGQ